MADLDNISKKEYVNDAEYCCNHVLTRWIDNGGHYNYPASWSGVYKLLCDAEKVSAAKRLAEALGAYDIEVEECD